MRKSVGYLPKMLLQKSVYLQNLITISNKYLFSSLSCNLQSGPSSHSKSPTFLFPLAYLLPTTLAIYPFLLSPFVPPPLFIPWPFCSPTISSYPTISPFNSDLSKATTFSCTTAPFCCLLIESLSSSNGSVRIIPEHRRPDRLIEGEIQRDKGIKRDATREAKSKRRDALGPDTFICALESLRAIPPLTRPTGDHMVRQKQRHFRTPHCHHGTMSVSLQVSKANRQGQCFSRMQHRRTLFLLFFNVHLSCLALTLITQ